MQSSFNRLTQEDAVSCRACYQRRFPSPGSGALTVCSSSAANPQAFYQQLVQEVGERVEQVETTCAAFPGGYYSQPFTQPLLFADRPNQTPIERVCPY